MKMLFCYYYEIFKKTVNPSFPDYFYISDGST